jgi:hypothetical protein
MKSVIRGKISKDAALVMGESIGDSEAEKPQKSMESRFDRA